MNEYVIYTDGSSLNNQEEDRHGGWAAIIFRKTPDGLVSRAELTGSEAGATNTKMELMGLMRGLEIIEDGAKIKVYSDSGYVVNTFNSWAYKWADDGWKRRGGVVAHLEEVQTIYKGLQRMGQFALILVKGHSGDKYNEQADKLAVAAAKKCKGETT